MKVIKKGRSQKGWAKQINCTGKGNGKGGCGAVLLIEESDLFQTSHTDMKGETDLFVTFRCSECKVLTDISTYPKDASSLPRERPSNVREGLTGARTIVRNRTEACCEYSLGMEGGHMCADCMGNR